MEEQIINIIRVFLQATASGDTGRALSFIAEDVEIAFWERTFKGKAEVIKFLTWIPVNSQDRRITETVIGIISQGDIGIIEHIFSGAAKSRKIAMPAGGILEVENHKIQSVRGFNNRLILSRKAASSLFARLMINSMIKAVEKGIKQTT